MTWWNWEIYLIMFSTEELNQFPTSSNINSNLYFRIMNPIKSNPFWMVYLNRQYCTRTPLDVYQLKVTKFKKMEGLTEKQIASRLKFWEAEKAWDATIDWEKLSDREIKIVLAHKEAVVNGHFTYDEGQGLKVITRLRHFLKGTCCGNACRHVISLYRSFDLMTESSNRIYCLPAVCLRPGERSRRFESQKSLQFCILDWCWSFIVIIRILNSLVW